MQVMEPQEGADASSKLIASKQHGQEVIIQRLVTRIQELEHKLYLRDLQDAEAEKIAQQASRPLGFLSAIRIGLRPFEETQGSTQPQQDSQQQPKPNTRIVYYETPPDEVKDQVQSVTPAPTPTPTPLANATQSTWDWMSQLKYAYTGPLITPPDKDSTTTPAKDKHSHADASLKDAVNETVNGVAAVSPGHMPVNVAVVDIMQTTSDATTSAATKSDASAATSGVSADSQPVPQPSTPKPANNSSSTMSAVSEPSQPSTPSAQPTPGKAATEWIASFFKKPQPQTTDANSKSRPESDRGLARASVSTSAGGDATATFSRPSYDPVDVAAEMEMTSRVRKAAAEALMQAEDKLRAAQAAQASLEKQVEEAKDLEKELAGLRAEKASVVAQRAVLEEEMGSAQAQMSSMRQAQAALSLELETLRSQASIWQSSSSDEVEKLRQENDMLRKQLQLRNSELTAVRGRLSDTELEVKQQVKAQEELHNKIKWLTKINNKLEESLQDLDKYRKQSSECHDKFLVERATRRRLQEQLQQIRGNVRVMCRVRPPSSPDASCVSLPLEGVVTVQPTAPGQKAHDFEFDNAFAPGVSQEAVYSEVSSTVRCCADGYNAAILSYGQTGSGKSYTLDGVPGQPGVTLRAVQELLRLGQEQGIDLHWRLQISMLAIHQDNVYDLLGSTQLLQTDAQQPVHPLDVSTNLDTTSTGSSGGASDRVQGAAWSHIQDIQAAHEVLCSGRAACELLAQALQTSIRRCHCVIRIKITAHHKSLQLASMLHIVDLAGSEKHDHSSKSDSNSSQAKDRQSVAKSLSCLGDVISAMQRKGSGSVPPARNSKLTQVLQDALSGGGSKVLLLCNVSPDPANVADTLATLNFAARASQIDPATLRRPASVNVGARSTPVHGYTTPLTPSSQSGVMSSGASAIFTERDKALEQKNSGGGGSGNSGGGQGGVAVANSKSGPGDDVQGSDGSQKFVFGKPSEIKARESLQMSVSFKNIRTGSSSSSSNFSPAPQPQS